MSKGKVFIGKVVAICGPKTIKVAVEDFYRHPLYKKTHKRRKKYLVNSKKEVAVGEKVVVRTGRRTNRSNGSDICTEMLASSMGSA